MKIPITTFVLPSGKNFPNYIDVRKTTGVKALEILSSISGRFTVERLRTGETSFAYESAKEGIDIDIEVNINGEHHLGAFDRLVERIHNNLTGI